MTYTLMIDGLPSCRRRPDGPRLLRAARDFGVQLVCTYGDRLSAERAGRLIVAFQGGTSEIVDGLVPHGDE